MILLPIHNTPQYTHTHTYDPIVLVTRIYVTAWGKASMSTTQTEIHFIASTFTVATLNNY